MREVSILEEVRIRLKKQVKALCQEVGIPSLASLRYDTIAVAETESRKVVNGREYYYERVQLKGEVKREGRPKTVTIKSWKKEEAPPFSLLHDLVYTYRAAKHLTRAIDNLHRSVLVSRRVYTSSK